MRLRVSASAINDRGPIFMEQAIAAIHDGMGRKQPITWSLARTGPSVALLCVLPDELRPLVERQLLAHYPSARVEALSADTFPVTTGHAWWVMTLTLAPEAFPIKRFPQFDDPATRTSVDPLAGILSTLAGPERDPLRSLIEITVCPARPRCERRNRHALAQLNRPIFTQHPHLARMFLRWAVSHRVWKRIVARLLISCTHRSPHSSTSLPANRLHDREDSRQAAEDKLGRRLFETQLRVVVSAPLAHRDRAIAKLREMVGALGQLTSPHLAEWEQGKVRQHTTLPSHRGTAFLFSAEELATLWHPPTLTTLSPTLDRASYLELEPPPVLPDPRREPSTAVLGRTAYRDRRSLFGIRSDDRRRHLYIAGKTGMGKSTLLCSLFANDVRSGRGCCLVDPHGDLSEAVLAAVPPPRTNHVMLFDVGDQAYPIAFNPLADCTPQARPLVASGMLTAFKKLYGDSWGPRLEHIFRNCLLALLEIPDASLVSLVQLLGDARYRDTIVNRVADPIVRSFWLREFAGMPTKLQAEAIAPIQNKVGQFVSSPLLRHILGQPRSTIDLRRIMDSGQVLIVNLSKGRTGEDASALLGSLIITALQLAAMGRADTAEESRPDFHLYVDEFQNFATESFATILSEARKYRLCLTIANQYLAQMDETTAAAVFGNVGSLLCFQVGANDSELLALQLGGQVTPQDLMAIPKYEAYLRLLIDGQPSRPFSMQTLAPAHFATDRQRAEIIRRASRRRYGRPRRQVELDVAQTFSAHP